MSALIFYKTLHATLHLPFGIIFSIVDHSGVYCNAGVMPERLLDNSAVLGRTPEMLFFDESWLTKTNKRASLRFDPSSLPGTPLTATNGQIRMIQQQKRFNVVSKGRTTEEVIAEFHYRRSASASFFDQCFMIKCTLGRGSFGEVLSVVSRIGGTAFAVKRSLKPYMSDFDRENALREVRNFSLIPDHPNLLHLELAWEERGLLYLQTELCIGNLEEYSCIYGFTDAHVLFILKDVLKALEALHHSGLVHFDVKPENILISSENTCKLGDFGLLFDMIKDQSGDYYHEGDNRYLDAAILDKNHHPSPSSDIFSLGLSVLELATDLHLPGNGDRWEDLRNGVLPDEFVAGLSSELRRSIQRMTDRDPTLRPTACQLLSEPFLDQLDYNKRPKFESLPRMSVNDTSPPRKKPRRSARLQIKNNEIPSPFRTPPSSNGGSEAGSSQPSTPVVMCPANGSPILSTPGVIFPLTPTRVPQHSSASRIRSRRLDFESPTSRLLSSC